MGRPHLLEIHKNDIVTYFNSLDLRSFTHTKLFTLLEDKKNDWGVLYNKSSDYIIDYLLKNELLIDYDLSDDSNNKLKIYSWRSEDVYTVLSGLKSGSYFSYYTALVLNNLTQQLPKVFYINSEHNSNSIRTPERGELSQEGIDEAFSREQRKSKNVYSLGDRKIILTNGKNTERLGIIENRNENQLFHYTDVERTLIDIVVRPAYSGGVSEILEAYKLAKEKVNIQKMASYLNRLDYIYPYAQAIGFYLERAGFTNEEIALFDLPKPYTFYLTYGIRHKVLSERWNLFYPKGI